MSSQQSEADEFQEAFFEATTSAAGIARLWSMLARARSQGRGVVAHAWADLIVGVSIQHGKELERAEALARELIAELPDKRHWGFLARVLEGLGRQDEAKAAREQESKAVNLHSQVDPEIGRQAIKDTLAAKGEPETSN